MKWKQLYQEARRLLQKHVHEHVNFCGCQDYGNPPDETPCEYLLEMEEFLRKTEPDGKAADKHRTVEK